MKCFLIAIAAAGCTTSSPKLENVHDAAPSSDAGPLSGSDGAEVADLSLAVAQDLTTPVSGCSSNDDCAALLPATTPPGCATAKCDVVAHACHFVAVDHDGDGHATATCTAPGTTIELGDDCNDNDANTYPGAWDGPVGDGHASACDGVDNDCNGSVDDGKLANGDICHCTPAATRSCADDGQKGTCAGGTETCSPQATWGACSVQPAVKDSCVLGDNDDNCNGINNEGCACPGHPTPANLGADCGSCGGKIQCDGSCSIATPANLNSPCNSCGGVIQCNGGCSTSQPANLGAACGSCGGTIQCTGTCSIATPGNLNAPCGSCGGSIQCNGSCSIATPGNLGAGCGSCGGHVQCNSTCSVSTPGNLGAACNSCGGTVQCNGACSTTQPANLGGSCNSCGGIVQCNGSCSTSQPANLGQPCGQCGGFIQCSGGCSIATPGDYGNVVNRSFNTESFSCCFINYVKAFGGGCDAGYVYDSVSIDKVSGGGGCEVVSEGSGTNCFVQVRFHNNGTDGATCNVTVHERRVCN